MPQSRFHFDQYRLSDCSVRAARQRVHSYQRPRYSVPPDIHPPIFSFRKRPSPWLSKRPPPRAGIAGTLYETASLHSEAATLQRRARHNACLPGLSTNDERHSISVRNRAPDSAHSLRSGLGEEVFSNVQGPKECYSISRLVVRTIDHVGEEVAEAITHRPRAR
jgi:hypothetical protein